MPVEQGRMLLEIDNDIPSPDQPTNTFVAIRPPWPVAQQVYYGATQLCSQAGIAGSRRPSSILHMTVLPIGRYGGRLPRKLLKQIDCAVSMVRLPAIEIMLNEAGSFETRKRHVPFVLEGSELAEVCGLRLAIHAALRVKGLNVPAPKAYAPHMTLAYASQRSPRRKVEPFIWQAREFQLIESWVGQTKYIELGRWALNHGV